MYTHHILAVLILQLPLDHHFNLWVRLEDGQTGLVLVTTSRGHRAAHSRLAGIRLGHGEGHIHTSNGAMNHSRQGTSVYL